MMEGSSFLSLLLLPIWFFDCDLALNVTLCRSRGIFLEPKQFKAETCALCYLYMPKTKFKDNFVKWNLTRSKSSFPPLESMLTNGSMEVNYSSMVLINKSFLSTHSFLDCRRCVWWGKSFAPNFPWWLLNQALERLLPSCRRMLSKDDFWKKWEFFLKWMQNLLAYPVNFFF